MHIDSDPACAWEEIQHCIAELSAHRGTRNAWNPPASTHMLPALDVFGTSSETLDELLHRYATKNRTDTRISASQLWKMYCYWSMLPITVGWLTSGHTPDLRAQHVQLALPLDATEIYFAAEKPQFFTGDDALLKGVRSVMEENLLPALEVVHTASGMGKRILTGTIASSALRSVGPLSAVLQRSLHEYAETLRTLLGAAGKLVTLAEVQPGADRSVQIHPERTTCCQKMRIPKETNCMNCPLITEQRRCELAGAEGLTWLSTPSVGSIVAQ